MNESQLIVGLTGGIASGKTAVSDEFERLGIDIIDSDIAARAVVERGTLGLRSIIERFGEGIVLRNTESNNVLDRHKLRKIVFDNETERQWLNNLLHPLIREWVYAETAKATSRYVIHAIPLLIESKLQSSVDVIITVDVPEEVQIERYLQREGSGMKQQIDKIMSRQCSRSDRIAYADYLIDNTGTFEDLKEEVMTVHQAILELCDHREMML